MSGADTLARSLASREGVSRAKAREAIEAARDVLTWRLGHAPPGRVMRLASAIIEHERRHGPMLTREPTMAELRTGRRQANPNRVPSGQLRPKPQRRARPARAA